MVEFKPDVVGMCNKIQGWVIDLTHSGELDTRIDYAVKIVIVLDGLRRHFPYSEAALTGIPEGK